MFKEPPELSDFELIAKALVWFKETYTPQTLPRKQRCDDLAEMYLHIHHETNIGAVQRIFDEAFGGDK